MIFKVPTKKLDIIVSRSATSLPKISLDLVARANNSIKNNIFECLLTAAAIGGTANELTIKDDGSIEVTECSATGAAGAHSVSSTKHMF